MRTSHQLWKTLAPFYQWAIRRFGPDVYHGGPPHDTYSELDSIERGDLHGAAIVRKHSLPVISETSEILDAGLNQDKYSDWPIVWSERPNAFLAAPSLAHLDEHGRACLESMFGPHAWTDPVWKRLHSRPLRILSGNHTSIISRWNNGQSYYHWFMDGLTRLMHLENFPDDTRILIPEKLPDFALRSLELLKLSDRTMDANVADLRIERYWFAGPTMLSGCPDIEGVTWLRNRFLTSPGQTPSSCIYIDRQATRRCCHNAKELREWFNQRGWIIVDPGMLSLDKQIQIFSNAKAVVGIHGAALTNLLWMQKGGRVLEIMPDQRRNGCYAGISLCVGLDHQTWVLPSDRLGNITVPTEKLADRISWMKSVIQ